MTTWRDFLVEHAKFPFPHPVENGTVSTTDVSVLDVGLLEREWKAQYAVRDETLAQKLCHTLDYILGDTLLSDESEGLLLSNFGRRLQFRAYSGRELEDTDWSMNESEVTSRTLLDKGLFTATQVCLDMFGEYVFRTAKEEHVEGGTSKVDYVGMVDDERKVLTEAKSPSVMKALGDSLPAHGIKLEWVTRQSLESKILHKAALYLGLRKMEWLFLTCHNYWIVCRLVRGADHKPFLAYSPMCSIEDSSEPFRAFLGALLSVLEDVPVDPSIFNPAMKPDVILEEVDYGPLPEDDIDDGSGAYRGSSNTTISSKRPATRGHEAAESGLMITSSSSHFPESFQVWVDLRPFSNNTFVLPKCAQDGNGKRRLWLTRFIGFGSTGNVWKCRFDNSDSLFAIKVVELLRRSDVGRQQRLRNEFGVYLTLEMAYQSGQLHDRITPHCYGAFEGDGVYVLILELCDGTLNAWNELNVSERTRVYQLVWDLHRVGISHDDLEPRNIARTPGGGFCLIDFSESREHICKEISGKLDETPSAPVPHYKCSELQAMRKALWKRQPLQTNL